MPKPESQGYEFKHQKRVFLDGYRGVARDIMVLNDPVADGFMRTGDIRRDVAIVQRTQDRAIEYDQLGNVKVAKFLQISRLDLWGDNTVQTRKHNDTWVVAINDQELAQKVAREGTGKSDFDQRYVEAFKQQVSKGLKEILKREKLLNGGQYTLPFFNSYITYVTKDLFFLPLVEISAMLKSQSPADFIQKTAVVAGAFAFLNGLSNTINLSAAIAGTLKESIGFKKHFLPYPQYDDPFIRHSFSEYVMPTVPIDRLIRGAWYLNKHGKELINEVK